MFKGETPTIQIQLLRLIDLIITEPERLPEVNQELASLKKNWNLSENLYSLDRIVWGASVALMSDNYEQKQQSSIVRLKNEILGKAPSWRTYALKNDFTSLLNGDYVIVYKGIISMISVLRGADSGESHATGYSALREQLFELCYDKLNPSTLPELIVLHICHILLQLPHDGSRTFDVTDDRYSFSLILPSSAVVDTDVLLNYVANMLNKMQGLDVLFVDINILSEGYFLSIR